MWRLGELTGWSTRGRRPSGKSERCGLSAAISGPEPACTPLSTPPWRNANLGLAMPAPPTARLHSHGRGCVLTGGSDGQCLTTLSCLTLIPDQQRDPHLPHQTPEEGKGGRIGSRFRKTPRPARKQSTSHLRVRMWTTSSRGGRRCPRPEVLSAQCRTQMRLLAHSGAIRAAAAQTQDTEERGAGTASSTVRKAGVREKRGLCRG